MLAAVLAGEIGFRLAADDPDDFRTQAFGPLTQDEPDTTRGRMDEDRVALGHLVSTPQQILSREALQHHGRGLWVGDSLRHLDQAVGRNVASFAVRAGLGEDVSHPIPDTKSPDLLAEGGDDARGLAAQAVRQLERIESGSLVDIDVVETDRGVTNLSFVRPGTAELYVLITEDFSTAVLIETDGFGHRPAMIAPTQTPCARWNAHGDA